MKKSLWYLIILVITGILLTGCKPMIESPPNNSKSEQPGEKPGDPSTSKNDQLDEQPDTPPVSSNTFMVSIEDTIMLEGMEEPIKLNLFDSGRNFITYVPDNMLAETVGSGEDKSYRFYANFNGKKNEDAYMQISFFPDNTEKPDLIGKDGQFTLEGLAMEPVERSLKKFDWSIEEYVGKGGAYGILGEHEGKYFSVLLHYPEEYEEGFVPRAYKILEHLYWTDTNELIAQ